jgi:hypothetical protein
MVDADAIEGAAAVNADAVEQVHHRYLDCNSRRKPVGGEEHSDAHAHSCNCNAIVADKDAPMLDDGAKEEEGIQHGHEDHVPVLVILGLD